MENIRFLTILQIVIVTCLMNLIAGKAKTKLDCMDTAQEGHFSKLICHINGTVKYGIQIRRPNNDLLIVCNVNTTCSKVPYRRDYCYIVNSPSEIIVVIESFRKTVDEGQWICTDGPPVAIGDSTCNKMSSSGNLNSLSAGSYSDNITFGRARTFLHCMTAPEEGLPATLVCVVRGTVEYGIKFIRPNGGMPEEVAMCSYRSTHCVTVGNNSGYSVMINTVSYIILTIKSFNKTVDEGEWICSDGQPPGTGDTKCNQTIPSRARTFLHCMTASEEGLPAKLVCVVRGTVEYGIKFIRPNGGMPEEVAMCSYPTTHCETVGSKSEYSIAINSASNIILTIKSFNKTVDEGEWICSDGQPPGIGDTKCNQTIPKSDKNNFVAKSDKNNFVAKIDATFISGASTHFDCMDEAEEELPTKLTCNIKGSVKFGIQIRRPDSRLVLFCDYKTVCLKMLDREGYCYLINSPQQITVTIARYRKNVDGGRWICSDGYPPGVGQTSCTKSIRKIAATTHLDCKDRPTEGHSTKLTCYIKGAISRGIRFTRPHSGHLEEVLICDRSNKKCYDVPYIPGYGYMINSPNQVTLIIKSFNKRFDEGKWICSDGAHYAAGNSSCIKITRNSRIVGSAHDMDFSHHPYRAKPTASTTFIDSHHRAKSIAVAGTLIPVVTIGSVIVLFLVSAWKRSRKPKIVYESFPKLENEEKSEATSMDNNRTIDVSQP